MTLHELIETRREQILRRWREAARATIAAENMPPRELVDSLPVFLDSLATLLRRAAESGEVDPTSIDQVAALHGAQRLHLGFAPHEVVREYGVLRDAIFEEARAARVLPSLSEFLLFSRCLSAAITSSVASYVRERDLELERQTAEHVGFLAHEIRNPLAVALAGLEVLRRLGVGAQERAGKVLARAERGIASAVREIDNALAAVRLRGGRVPRPEELDAREQLAAAAEEVSLLADDREVRIVVEAQEGLRVEADPRLLQSALLNLLQNAVKFSARGGTVVSRARKIETRTRFEVEDECGGLPPGAAEQLFNPFVQMGKNRSGFGLGLAIARQATEAHGGNLSVHNLPGKGCIFLLEFPEKPSSA